MIQESRNSSLSNMLAEMSDHLVALLDHPTLVLSKLGEILAVQFLLRFRLSSHAIVESTSIAEYFLSTPAD